MSSLVDDDNLLKKINTEDVKNIGLNVLPVYDNRYIKTKITKYGHQLCTNFCGLN